MKTFAFALLATIVLGIPLKVHEQIEATSIDLVENEVENHGYTGEPN